VLAKGVLMTNSGKFAHYAPGNTGYFVLYGSLADCVESAVTGRPVFSDIDAGQAETKVTPTPNPSPQGGGRPGGADQFLTFQDRAEKVMKSSPSPLWGGVRGGGSPQKAETLVPGATGEGEALVLTAPISFWGGVDAKTGRIADVRHPQCGQSIAGRVLFLPGTIGSSSASAVLMELVHNGHAPAALVLHEPDAILLLGLIVAREMGWQTPPALRLARESFDAYRGRTVAISENGQLTIAS
jgi:predicted aconitase with swiveling domain